MMPPGGSLVAADPRIGRIGACDSVAPFSPP